MPAEEIYGATLWHTVSVWGTIYGAYQVCTQVYDTSDETVRVLAEVEPPPSTQWSTLKAGASVGEDDEVKINGPTVSDGAQKSSSENDSDAATTRIRRTGSLCGADPRTFSVKAISAFKPQNNSELPLEV